MAEDPLRTVIDGIHTRLRSELEAQLSALTDTHHQALNEARRAAEAAAEERWAAKLEATRTELAERLQSDVAAARAEAERESARRRTEAEQSAAEAVARAHRELEQARVAEGERAQAAADAAAQARRELEEALATERRRAQTLDETAARTRAEIEQAVASERDRARAAAAEAAAQAGRELEQAVAAERQRAQTAVSTGEQSRRELEQAVAAERERARAAIEAAAQSRRELEQTAAAERDRARTASEAAAQLRTELEQSVNAERERARAAIEAERQRAEREVSEARAAFEAERARTSHAFADSGGSAAAPRNTAALVDAMRAIDTAASLSDALAAVVRGAALEAPRVTLFVVNGTQLQEWPVPGVPGLRAGAIDAEAADAGVLGDVLRKNETLVSGRNGGGVPPRFASLPAGRAAVAVPFVLGGQPVAVLYADEGVNGNAPSSWQETVQILGRHAAAYVAYFTAFRTAQAMRLVGEGPASRKDAAKGDVDDDQAQGARRYARLLVSEIKLYNEHAVRTGRERRDLLQRLKPEIDRARRLYDERVAPSISAREVYFQQELVQTLADGDQSLLG